MLGRFVAAQADSISDGRLWCLHAVLGLGNDKFRTLLQVEQLEGAELADFLLSLEPEGWDRSKAIADRPPKHVSNTVSPWPHLIPVLAHQ